MKNLNISAVAAAVLYLCPSLSAGTSIAVTDATGSFFSKLITASNGSTFGYAFTTSQDIVIDYLGIWDEFGNGLYSSHQVGIWDSGMNLLVSAEIGSGTSSAALGNVVQGGQFRYEPIELLTLYAETEYFIAAQYFAGSNGTTDSFLSSDGTALVSTDSLITITDTNRFHVGSFAFPQGSSLNAVAGYLGPNFSFTPVPEPSMSLLLLLSGGASMMRRRRCLDPQ